MIDYISEFNSVVSRLESMEVTLHEELLVAILLRGLPGSFAMFVTAFKHRDKIPPLDQVIAMLCAQGQTQTVEGHMGEVRCSGCNRTGHSLAKCWELHPEMAPVCKKCSKKGHIAINCPNKSQPASDMAMADYHFPVFEQADQPICP
jgi:hypothetical protein